MSFAVLSGRCGNALCRFCRGASGPGSKNSLELLWPVGCCCGQNDNAGQLSFGMMCYEYAVALWMKERELKCTYLKALT